MRYGICLVICLLALIPLTASQVTSATIEELADPALFSKTIVENMVLWYNVTEFETPTGEASGPVAIGYETLSSDGNSYFWARNITLTEGDLIYIKVDTQDDTWEDLRGDHSMLYSGWQCGFLGLSPVCNVTLWPGGNAPPTGNWSQYELDEVFYRMALFPTHTKLRYPPQDGQNYSDKLIPMFGAYDDNGTINPGYWTGTYPNHVTNTTYDWNSTYYMWYASLYYILGSPNPVDWTLHLVYNKIPARFSTGTNYFNNLTTFAHWNYSFYDMWGAWSIGQYSRLISFAYVDGLWPLLPYVFVKTDIKTGITESMEFYFGDDSAWTWIIPLYNSTLSSLLGLTSDWEPHPLTTQVKKLKLELYDITYPGPSGVPGFEVPFVGIAFCLLATVVIYLSRKQKK